MAEGTFIDMLGLKTCLCNFSVVPTDSQSLCPYPKKKIAIEQKMYTILLVNMFCIMKKKKMEPSFLALSSTDK